MRERETLPPEVHPEVALLPWYANGTLASEEREQVARHLESCPDCRRELDELMQIKHELTAVYRVHPEPSDRLARSVLANVAQEASTRRHAPAETRSRLDGLDRWIRSLLMPQWVPTLVAVVLVAQLGLLLWVTMPSQQGQVTTRSLSSATVTFKIIFQEQATEGQIRALLNTIRGRVIDGPNPEQAYFIEVITGDPSGNVKALETLRERADVVYSAEAISQ